MENRHIDDVTINSILVRYCTKQLDSMLPCFRSVMSHIRRQNLVRKSVPHSAALRVPLFCPDCILMLSVIKNGTDARQHPNSTSVRDTPLVLVR